MDPTDKVSNIIPHIYITNWPSSNNLETLKSYNIKAVINVTPEQKPADTLMYMKTNHIDYLQIPILDTPNENILQYFNQTYDFINKHVRKKENVLIHCMAGVSRSVTITANYMARDFISKFSPEETLDFIINVIRQSRPIVNPNGGFKQQLLEKIREYSLKNRNKSQMSQYNEEVPKFKELENSPSREGSCAKSFLDADGRPAPVICLTNSDFDEQGNLPSFSNVNGVVFFGSNNCSHCQRTKPAFANFAKHLPRTNIRAFYIEGPDNKELLMRINPTTWGYLIRGFPTIVSYNNGRFFSEYDVDQANPQAFRTTEDLLEYAKGIGAVQVEMV